MLLFSGQHKLQGENFNPNIMPKTEVKKKESYTPAFKILDAPGIEDDFYLNLLDWGEQCLAISLKPDVYIQNPNTSFIKTLQQGYENGGGATSLAWKPGSSILAVGKDTDHLNVTQIWDLEKMRVLRTMQNHTDRVSSLAWNENILSTGSKDSKIINYDMRKKEALSVMHGHKKEVCGLKWSPDGTQLASGSNDNSLCIWSLKNSDSPQFCLR